MGAIKPATDAQYFSKKGHPIFESTDRGSGAHDAAESSSNPTEAGIEDNLDFSPRAQEILRSIAKEVSTLFNAYPQYRHLFEPKGAAANAAGHPLSGLAFIGHFRSFLGNPSFQKLAQQDQEFGDFYAKVQALGHLSQAALSQTQKTLKEAPAITYSRPRRPID
ncbi:MAG: hypothetical protein KDK78_01645 [Chlamydiia bacterium]|nr:hypothetical protein [Chlamydiia bacterium]